MAGATINGRTFTLQELFDQAIYSIDNYQREYAWTDEDVRILVNDLCGKFGEARRDPRTRRGIHHAHPYFLGPFVYYEEGHGVRFLVDGQQRFTTLHLMFMHLHRQAVALGYRNAVDKLVPVIRKAHEGRWRFRIDIAERRDALQALYDGRDYEPGLGSSLSLRNLCARSAEMRELLESRLDAEEVSDFIDWMLTRVLMVGIEAPTRASGFHIFESMNDRGSRLTPVDLLKSYLLSSVGENQEEELNGQWRTMLAELTPGRDDPGGPSRFLKAALIAHYARLDEGFSDVEEINSSLHLWVRRNARGHLFLHGPERYFEFMKALIDLAKIYRTFQSATLRMDREHGLEAIYFNHANGLTNQMAFILAAIRPGEIQSAKAKARVVANFIDRWYVVRVLADEPALDRDLDELMSRIIPQLRKCERLGDVATFLASEMPGDGNFQAVTSFGLRGNNSAQVRYLLARLTAFAQTGWGEEDRADDYIAPDRRWQIEHIFPNRPERHPEIGDPVEFRLLRNRIAVLGLLKSSVNASLQDTPLERKIEVYRSENLLLRCLHPTFRQNNKPIRTFIQQYELDSHLRPLGASDLRGAVTLRGELYRRLCAAVWDLRRLGFPAGPGTASRTAVTDPSAIAVESKRPRSRPTDVQRMLRSGVLSAGTTLTGLVADTQVQAHIEADGSIRLSTGDLFRKADDAGRAVTGKRCEGMKFWHVTMPDGNRISLRDLRNLSAAGPKSS
ncbi:GmrSD restriction endonuclease domain-containing protein [Bailinhaonella thermotolerans]|uniref:DUF262 domain-containing protein n=1 Tax=Bailinhaonella thermotolerans TaxID=1070861 RepID=A0A3A4B203_9ACTN|nr:DUF262 domain-containing protein [Bailinhaonella thermotolerans]RJL35765.1 DUF262 domain-containing protein [Bailinhaonella thermotolerans]